MAVYEGDEDLIFGPIVDQRPRVYTFGEIQPGRQFLFRAFETEPIMGEPARKRRYIKLPEGMMFRGQKVNAVELDDSVARVKCCWFNDSNQVEP